MKDLKTIILEKLNYKSSVTKKICKAFGLIEEDEWTNEIDKWVTDNNVKSVSFYTKNISELEDMGMPKSIIKLYSDDRQIISKINQALKSYETLVSDDEFDLIATDQVLAFVSKSDDELYAYVNK